jgi:NAD(P)-dependent dehydrogenase (short-subunit alcohol dehydrogenase family)
MNESLRGRRALVTGGSKGIGFAVARALLEKGANVAIFARSENPLREAIENLRQAGAGSGGKIVGQVADVSRSGDVARFFEFAGKELGGLDILVNNAGLGIFRPAAELTVEEWDRQIGVNLSGAFYCSREALRRFDSSRGGWIVNISSLAGKNPFSGGAGYNASKFGLNGFSEAMMLDHRNDNVRVSYIMPGSVDTHFSGKAGENASNWKIAPEDIAQIVLNVLQMPARTLISRIEVRPSRPEKN